MAYTSILITCKCTRYTFENAILALLYIKDLFRYIGKGGLFTLKPKFKQHFISKGYIPIVLRFFCMCDVRNSYHGYRAE